MVVKHVARSRPGPFTYDDFRALVEDGQKADLIDGVIYMASPDNTDANELFVWLLTVINMFARQRKLGKVYGSRVACRLDEKNAPEPDIVFVSNRRLAQIKRGGIQGAPNMALEIVSPDSVERDYEKKHRQYERFAVPEYWIVDELEHQVLLFRLDTRGKYREVKARRGQLHSQALTGFWLNPAWLWHRPLPDELATLQQIMAA